MKQRINHFNSQDWILADDFYSIDFTTMETRLQGKYNSNVATKYKAMGFAFSMSDSGYIEGSQVIDGFKYDIILT